jgi:hypothetical protein
MPERRRGSGGSRHPDLFARSKQPKILLPRARSTCTSPNSIRSSAAKQARPSNLGWPGAPRRTEGSCWCRSHPRAIGSRKACPHPDMERPCKRKMRGACFFSFEVEQKGQRSKRLHRRLITLIFEDRARARLIVVIRRELPRTNVANLGKGPSHRVGRGFSFPCALLRPLTALLHLSSPSMRQRFHAQLAHLWPR